jgi:uncharacterized membrane protein YhaH (DUF805 family)
MALGIHFEGRLSREDYARAQVALGVAPLFLAIVLAPVIWFVSAVLDLRDFGSGILVVAVIGVVVAVQGATLANDVRRLHDLGYSGGWLGPTTLLQAAAFLLFVTQLHARPALAAVGFLTLSAAPAWLGLQLRFKRGLAGPNRYGEPPQPPGPGRPDFAPIPVKRRDLDAELREARQALNNTREDLDP